MSAPAILSTVVYPWLHGLNKLVCRLMYGVRPPLIRPLPIQGPALIVCDHTSMGDPLVLLATAGRPIRFLMAEEIYVRSQVRWVFQAFRCIPVKRGKRDIRAIRLMLEGLAAQEVIGLFPEGGLDRHRVQEGHPGVGYLAIKSGVPVIPASILWARERSISSMAKTLLVPCQATIRYGTPLQFPKESHPGRASVQSSTKEIMARIESLRNEMRKENSGLPLGSKETGL